MENKRYFTILNLLKEINLKLDQIRYHFRIDFENIEKKSEASEAMEKLHKLYPPIEEILKEKGDAKR